MRLTPAEHHVLSVVGCNPTLGASYAMIAAEEPDIAMADLADAVQSLQFKGLLAPWCFDADISKTQFYQTAKARALETQTTEIWVAVSAGDHGELSISGINEERVNIAGMAKQRGIVGLHRVTLRAEVEE